MKQEITRNVGHMTLALTACAGIAAAALVVSQPSEAAPVHSAAASANYCAALQQELRTATPAEKPIILAQIAKNCL